jgi:tetratricopeptide (TPR) repeat protein
MRNSTPAIFLSGKVAIDDGTVVTEPVGIQTVCRGLKRTVTHSDSHGSFSFQLASPDGTPVTESVGDAETVWSNNTVPRGSANDWWKDCELQAGLPGFSSTVIELSSQQSPSENIDIGRIVLHRIGLVQGFTISATSAMAPDEARKAYMKGLEDEKKSKWEAAHELFNKAVHIYSRYAIAWLELGRVQVQQNDPSGARQAFQHALEADPKFVSPYEELAQLAAHEKQWQEVVDTTEKLNALNPLLPRAWFLSAVANYNLGRLEGAEKSARQGLKLDEERRIPRIEYLLALILMDQNALAEAAEHFRAYLQLAPKADDADAARKQLAQITKPSAASVTPPADNK